MSRLLTHLLVRRGVLRVPDQLRVDRRCVRSRFKDEHVPYQTHVVLPSEQPLLHKGLKSLFRPTLFTLGFSTAVFTGTSIWQYENMRRSRENGHLPWVDNRARVEKVGSLRETLNHAWRTTSEDQRIFLAILATNVAVYAAWKIPHFRPFMMRYFAHNPASKAQCLPMVLSCFSHMSLLHLVANMYVLHSFTPTLSRIMGREQFVALYLTSGVWAALASSVLKVFRRSQSLSLGASGCIFGLIGLFSSILPEQELHIVLLPHFTFSSGNAAICLIGFDLLGCIQNWRILDHAAHLGGMLFGKFWANIGSPFLWPQRRYVMQWWHENVRSNRKSGPDQ